MDELLRSQYRSERARRRAQFAASQSLSPEERTALRQFRASRKRAARRRQLGRTPNEPPEAAIGDIVTPPAVQEPLSPHYVENRGLTTDRFHYGDQAQQQEIPTASLPEQIGPPLPGTTDIYEPQMAEEPERQPLHEETARFFNEDYTPKGEEPEEGTKVRREVAQLQAVRSETGSPDVPDATEDSLGTATDAGTAPDDAYPSGEEQARSVSSPLEAQRIGPPLPPSEATYEPDGSQEPTRKPLHEETARFFNEDYSPKGDEPEEAPRVHEEVARLFGPSIEEGVAKELGQGLPAAARPMGQRIEAIREYEQQTGEQASPFGGAFDSAPETARQEGRQFSPGDTKAEEGDTKQVLHELVQLVRDQGAKLDGLGSSQDSLEEELQNVSDQVGALPALIERAAGVGP